MRGKIAFVLGLGLGYVLGTRAGRQRYEQIKRGAQKLWDSPGVKAGRHQVGGYVSEVSASLQDSVIDAGKNFVQTVFEFAKTRNNDAQSASTPAQPEPSASARTRGTTGTAGTTRPAQRTAAKKPPATKAASSKTSTQG